ncbi:MAG: CDP-glycerol--glycerophosphate glycerophosphotransferase [Actinobacteria bacterium]|nr:CDP-glycerol--glycerophosphate glycerophosphotransferase [Actinomycetota bacterium]
MVLRRRRSGRKGFERLEPRQRAITFYAEDGGSWPHFEPILRELTGRLGRTVCYLTSSAADPVLALDEPRILAFEIGEGFGRSYLFQTMEAGVVVATVPRLGIPVLPRSKRADALGMTYVYVFHSMVSTHMVYDADGFDHYDTVLCVGPHMVEEIRRREQVVGLEPKELLEHGYGRLDTILETARATASPPPSEPPTVLVAPSWGPTCIFESCGAEVVGVLLDAGYKVVARPHPMSAKRTPAAIAALRDRFARHPRFTLDLDIATHAPLQRADVMVSDWSGAALEYAFGLERPVCFVDVPRKVNNPDYGKLGIEPFEATVREEIGRVVGLDALAGLPAVVGELAAASGDFRRRIAAARDEHVFNVGSSGRVGAEVIAAKADAYLASMPR